MRRARIAWVAGVVLLAGCPSKPPEVPCPDGPETCECTKSTDCGEKSEWLCSNARCRRLCKADGDCASGEVCEDSLCRADGCGSDAECSGGDLCLAGECKSPLPGSVVKSCFVQPVRMLLKDGVAREVSIHAVGADGLGVAYRGKVEWSVDFDDRASVAGTTEVVAVRGGVEEGAVELRARIPGGVACTPANGENYEKVRAGVLRVVAADLQSSAPVANARVIVEIDGQRLSAKTDARGVARFDVTSASAATVSVFDSNHAYVTYVDVRSRDLAVFLKPFPSRNGFSGTLPREAFANLPEVGEGVHLGLFGSSMPGNILDLQMATLFGDPTPTDLELGDIRARVVLPSGVVMGLNERMFREQYDVFAAPGLRTLWGIAGNGNFQALFNALAPLLVDGQGELQTGTLVNTVVPLIGRFHSGVLTGMRTPPDATLAPVDVPLSTPLRLKLAVTVPALPTFVVDGQTARFEGALLVGGALNKPQGFVPLGLSAAVDAPSKGGALDGLVTNPDPMGPAGVLPLRVAPLHSGLESSKHVIIGLAASFSSIGPGGQQLDDAPLVLSGLVQLPPPIRYSSEATAWSFPRPFLGVPRDPAFIGRVLVPGPAVEGAAFHRLDIGSSWAGEWYVYFPPGRDEVLVPSPPVGYDDRLVVPAGETPAQLMLQSVRLNDAGVPLDYDAVLSFDGNSVDDLTGRLDAFSSREIPR